MEGILALQLAGSGDGQDSFGESLPCFGLIAKTKFSPLYGRPDSLFRCIVGGLYPLVGEESEKISPILEGSLGSSTNRSVRATFVFQAISFHSSPHEGRGIQELVAVNVALAESVPAREDMPDLCQHILSKHISIRAAAAFLEAQELANQVCPAELPQSFLMVGAVG